VRALRTIAGLWVTTVVAAAVALCTVLSGPVASDGDGGQTSVAAATSHAAQPGWTGAHLRFSTKLVAALPAGPQLQPVAERPFELPPHAIVVSALSTVPRASRGPPASPIVDR
jgi:hypothetical protein